MTRSRNPGPRSGPQPAETTGSPSKKSTPRGPFGSPPDSLSRWPTEGSDICFSRPDAEGALLSGPGVSTSGPATTGGRRDAGLDLPCAGYGGCFSICFGRGCRAERFVGMKEVGIYAWYCILRDLYLFGHTCQGKVGVKRKT